MSVRVVVVDDQELVRAGFVALLSSAADLDVVGEAGHGEEAVRLTRSLLPDVVLMDIRMPVLDGIEATRLIFADPITAGVRVLVLTTFALDELVFGALRAGASGFLLKDTPPAELLHAVRVVAEGEALLSPSITRRLIQQFTTSAPRPAAVTLPELTGRETDVLTLVAQGLTNGEIAAQLHVGVATVKTYVGRLLDKLAVPSRVHLVIAAYEGGLAGVATVAPPSGD